MDEPGLTRLLLGLASNEPERVERSPGTTSPGVSCLPLSRIRTRVLKENWSDSERAHLSGCTHCRKSEQLARKQVWHPSLVHLFWHARGLIEHSDEDAGYHLTNDACRRCLRLTNLLGIDRILARLAGQVRSGLSQATHRLGKTLATGAVATLQFSALSGAANLRVPFEDERHFAVVSSSDPAHVRLEIPADGPAPRLLRVLAGDSQAGSDHLVVPHASPEPATHVAEVMLANVPPGRACLALYEVDASLLTRDDAPQLRSAWAVAAKLNPQAAPAWQTWASQSLQRSDLDGMLRPALESLARADGGKPSL